jgi:hypothetical protein
MTRRRAPAGTQHPEEWRQDLNPDASAGINAADVGADPEKAAPKAYDVKETHDLLQDFTDGELKRILIMPPGSRLKQGATYINLKDPARREFTATADMEVEPDNWYVSKSELDYQLWNRLIGVENPERLGEADAS